MIKHIEEFTLCLNEQRYYDAHEALEEVWFPRRFEDNDEMKLIKGFINASVSFELYKQGKIPQSQKVWKNYLKYRPLLDTVDSIYLAHHKQVAQHIENIQDSHNY